MPTCPSCGREQDRPSAFCTSCGAVLDRPAAEPSDATQQGQHASALPPDARQIFPGPPPPGAPDHGDIGAYIVRRTFALALDLLVVGALIAIAARAWIAKAAPGGSLTLAGFAQLCLVVAGALFVYRWLLGGLAGTTLGKLTAGLVIARSHGGRAGLGRTFVRELLLPIDLAIIGFLLAAVLPRRQRIGDLVAGTVVVNSRIGALAPLLGIVALGLAAYATAAYAGGVAAARELGTEASKFAPSLVSRETPLPSPAATSAPTQAPSASPTSSPGSPKPGATTTPPVPANNGA